MKLGKTLALPTVLMSTLPFQANAEFYDHLAVNLYIQQDACWCAIANVEMISDWLEGKSSTSKAQQKTIAERYRVGEYTEGSQYSNGYTCLRDNGTQSQGLSVTALANALDYEVGTIKKLPGYDFKDLVIHSSSLAAEAGRHVAWGKPLIVSADTVYVNGKPSRPYGHYMLIDAVWSFNHSETEIKGAYGSTGSNYIDRLWVNDSSYGSPYTPGVKSISPRTQLTKNALLDRVSTNSSNQVNFIKY